MVFLTFCFVALVCLLGWVSTTVSVNVIGEHVRDNCAKKGGMDRGYTKLGPRPTLKSFSRIHFTKGACIGNWIIIILLNLINQRGYWLYSSRILCSGSKIYFSVYTFLSRVCIIWYTLLFDCIQGVSKMIHSENKWLRILLVLLDRNYTITSNCIQKWLFKGISYFREHLLWLFLVKLH